MLKVQSRAELHAITGKKPEAAKADPLEVIGASMVQLAQAVQASAVQAAQAQENIAQLTQSMEESSKKDFQLVADIVRDKNDKMKRVIITVQRGS